MFRQLMWSSSGWWQQAYLSNLKMWSDWDTFNNICILVHTTLKMTKWIAETCWWHYAVKLHPKSQVILLVFLYTLCFTAYTIYRGHIEWQESHGHIKQKQRTAPLTETDGQTGRQAMIWRLRWQSPSFYLHESLDTRWSKALWKEMCWLLAN